MNTPAEPIQGFRMSTPRWAWHMILALAFTALVLLPRASVPAPDVRPVPAKKNAFLAPSAIAASPDGSTLYVACAETSELLTIQASSRKILNRVHLSDAPSGIAVSRDGANLYITCASASSQVLVVDAKKGRVTARLRAGYQAQSPVLSPDGTILYVCNRFDNDLSVFDLAKMKEIRRIHVPREPFSAAITRDGRRLLVANHLHSGRSDVDVVASSVSVIDLASGVVVKDIPLPNGSMLLREIRISPDGRHAVVAHVLARFHLPTTQIDRGWINTNAGSILDLEELKLLNTVLFDNVDSGASTPWAVDWSADGRKLFVTHAGTHELTVLDFPGLLAKLSRIPAVLDPAKPVDYTAASKVASDVPNDLSFLVGLRERIRLQGQGPRALVAVEGGAWVANYFSDSISFVRTTREPMSAETFPLGPAPQMTRSRIGERNFNDASLCFQGWQACSSCHSHDARVDAMNWDNLNDGIGNPKNSKSLLQAHQTPPSMWLGVRSNANVAVRAGIRNSLFTVQPPEVAEAIDDYLKSLKPMPSPHLIKGKLTPAAERGKGLFFEDSVGCASCHKGPYYTDLKSHNVGTVGKFDQPTDRFDTPTLIELWRTGPYLHDGRAVNLREVLTKFQSNDKHGNTSQLTPQQIDDLVEFLLSL